MIASSDLLYATEMGFMGLEGLELEGTHFFPLMMCTHSPSLRRKVPGVKSSSARILDNQCYSSLHNH